MCKNAENTAAHPPSTRRVITALAFALALSLSSPGRATYPIIGDTVTAEEYRFAVRAGAASRWNPATQQEGPAIGFSGRARLSCSALDYSGFLRAYDPRQLLNEIRGQLLSGAQAAVMNYLVTLAYATPTLASVLDTLHQNYSARFGSFQTACNAQQAQQQGLNLGARRMASVQDQCYDAQVNSGASPTAAYQACANEQTLGGLADGLPAAKGVLDFLRDHTNLQVTPAMQALFGLLPDIRIGGSGLEVAPPQVTLYQLNRNIGSRVSLALDRVLAGEAPASIPDCAGDAMNSPGAVAGDACLASAASGLIQSAEVLSVRQLSASARALYRDVISGQVAIAQTRSALVDLMSQVRQLSPRPGQSARDILERRRELGEQIALLTKEADALQAYQQARAATLNTQLMASELSAAAIAQSAQVPSAHSRGSTLYNTLRGLLAL